VVLLAWLPHMRSHKEPCPGKIDKSHPIHPRNEEQKKKKKVRGVRCVRTGPCVRGLPVQCARAWPARMARSACWLRVAPLPPSASLRLLHQQHVLPRTAPVPAPASAAQAKLPEIMALPQRVVKTKAEKLAEKERAKAVAALAAEASKAQAKADG
jgi:hypothetical protein